MGIRRNLLEIEWVVPVLLVSSILINPGIARSQLPATSNSSNAEVDSEFIDQNYILGPGDQVEIIVFDYEEYTGQKVILPDGTITLSLIGSLNTVGLTTGQLDQALTTRLQTLLVNPVVTVELITPRPVTVTVAGQVRRPGPTELQELAAEGGGVPTLSKALIAAGGITQDADIQQVTINREVVNGELQTITVNLWEAITSDNAASDVILQEGDSIYVPRLATDTQVDRRLIARSSFAPETVRVRVVGEVTQPGEIEVPPDSTISSAVAIAGGPTEDARLSKVAFIRLNEVGEIEREIVDLRNLTDSYQVQEGDVIIVPERADTSILDFAARALGPFGSLLNILTDIEVLSR